MTDKHYPILCGFFSYLVIILILLLTAYWPYELNPIFDDLFLSISIIFGQSCLIIIYLYIKRGGSTRNVRFVFGLMLIFASALMFSGIDQIAKNTDGWKQHYSTDYIELFNGLRFTLSCMKDIISIGIGALGANVAGFAITEPKVKRKSFKRTYRST